MAGRRLIGWRAWLATEPDARDLRVVTSRETSFTALPDHALQAVILYREDGTRHAMWGNDFYWLTAAACEGIDTCFGSGQTPPKDAAIVLEGKAIDDQAFARIESAAWATRTLDG